jgi:hypothetical protein
LHKDRRVFAERITLRSATAVTTVKMPGQIDVNAAAGKARHGHRGPSDEFTGAIMLRHIERMMRDNDFQPICGRITERRFHALHLVYVHPAALDRKTSRGIQPGNRDFFVLIKRFEIRGDVVAIVVQSVREPGNDMRRHIMVSGNHDLRLRQRIEELPGALEFLPSRALRQVAGKDNDIGIELPYCRDERVDRDLMRSPEMYVGKMNDGTDKRLLGNNNAQLLRTNPVMKRRLHPHRLAVGRYTDHSTAYFNESLHGGKFLQFIGLPQLAEQGAHKETEQAKPGHRMGDRHEQLPAFQSSARAEVKSLQFVFVITDK